MGKSANIVEINGNQYDALSGQLIGSVKRLAKKAAKPYHNLTIDGFVRAPNLGPKIAEDSTAGLRTQQAAQAVHRGAQRSRTLMRGLVKKPAALSSQKIASPPKITHSDPTLSSARLSRAQTIPKDAKVSRFGIVTAPFSYTKAEGSSKLKAVHHQQVDTKSVTASATIRPMPSMITSASHHQLERLLDRALTNASAHKQSLRRGHTNQTGWHRVKRTPRWLGVGAVLAAAISVVGFLAWQNLPQVAVRVASIGSDVSASVPSYSPSGFSFAGPLTFTDSTVTMKFTSNADPARTYSIVQKNSDWDSASLLANYIEPAAETYQTSKVKGSTVYIYGAQNHATWVNNGTWYVIKDNASLNSDQLLKIAEGL